MATLTTAFVPSKLNPLHSGYQVSPFAHITPLRKKINQPVARLFGPAIFEVSKLEVLFLGMDQKKHPADLPRTYTLTHSDITSKITLSISQTINNSQGMPQLMDGGCDSYKNRAWTNTGLDTRQLQGWYNKLQRDEVVAHWRKIKGKMSLHVHLHVSGGHFLLDMCASIRYFIFRKELPVVLNAFSHGDKNLFKDYPELHDALVWVYFHSNISEFNKVECWGPLKDACAFPSGSHEVVIDGAPQSCQENCECCFIPMSSITWSQELLGHDRA
ncbi:protein STAY-GREEN homolog, chloroplastic-like isoform X1 [Glycine soja]|nr:protein STAY-GREEN homolog, chloroplastic-like isoform X1 [Glycine soja]KAG4933093.1 hypothetical protein JHK87_047095 [Glycine soja]KHN09739.1 hypothetical protein glysoja_017040 [Glycine soja]RZB56711.1 Protein STAY-GREEN, chloroplastic [Glycine soja]